MNRMRKSLLTGTAAVAALVAATSGALAQNATRHHQGPEQGGGRGAQTMAPDQGMGSGQGMMDPAMMRMMMDMMHGQCMDRGRTMEPGMGRDMGPRMMGDMGGEGMVVRPIQHLTVEDVRHFLEHRLQTRGNDRLKVGEVEQVDDDTIVAEVVTVDDSLVERFEVDRHSGRMTPEPASATDAPAN